MVKWLKLKECCEILDSKRIPITAAKRKKGPYPYYGANGVQDYIDDYIFDDELVLLAEDGGNFGSREKPIAYRISGKCWVNNHAHVLKPKKGLNVDYLCYSLAFYNVDKLINGATRKKLTQGAVKDMEIPVVSLATQHKIVSQIKKVQSIKKLRQQQLNKLNKLIKARFVEMFGDPFNNQKKFNMVKLGDIAELISGGTPSRKNMRFYNGNIPFITTVALGHTYIESKHAQDFITIEGVKNSSTKIIRKNTLLVGSRVGVGKTSITDTDVAINQDIVALNNIDLQSYDLFYLKAVLDKYQYYFDLQKRGATIKGITAKIIKQVQIPVAPIELQEDYHYFVQQVDKSKVAVQKSLDETQKLFDSLMQEYFG